MLKTLLKRLRHTLLARADRPRENFRLMMAGFITFMVGGALVAGSGLLLNASLLQELLAAVGLIMMGGGIILAALGYISLSLLRLLRFFIDDLPENQASHDRTTPP
ncbi:MAG: hypothetical protein OIF57_12245 [Marinobacterium sp.]|nr:hypothetical protein [Marinobacterium sp.]